MPLIVPERSEQSFGGKNLPEGSFSCSHCGLPVPSALVDRTRAENFCCSGCETVFSLLKGAGLGEYYAFRTKIGEKGQRALDPEVLGASAEFDTTSFRELYCDKLPGGELKTELLVEGVHCAACVWLVEKLPRLEPAVLEARLDMARSSVTLVWDDAAAPLSRIAKTLSRMGYRPRPFRGREAARMRRDELRSLLIRIGVAGAVAGNVMLMAFALYSGEVGLDEAGTMDATTTRFFETLSLIVSLPALWAGSLFFRGAWSALRTRTPHMDLPIAIGILAGFGWGSYGVLSGAGEIYFDSITTLIFLLLVGRYLQRRHQLAAADAAELMHAVVPGVATVFEGGATRQANSAEISPGVLVQVESGEVVPVDGIVREGCSALDKSLLSGEARPVSVAAGDFAEAGSLNLGSRLVIEATEAGEQTRVARLMREVEKALSTRTKLVGQADRIAGVFTVAVLLLALVVAVYWVRIAGAAGIEHALALLIVACPCALGMATPLALSASVSQAARTKKLIFSPGALEELARPLHVVLDKTGTLTYGRLTVTHFEGDEQLFSLVGELERASAHPVAVALRDFVENRSSANELSLLGPVRETTGSGLVADTNAGQIAIGSCRFVLARAKLSPALENSLTQGRGGEAPVLLSLGSEVRAIFWLGDKIREDAASSLVALAQAGHRLHLLSGDHPRTAQSVGQALARAAGRPDLFVSVSGGVTPEEKLQRISEFKERGERVCMVGDGVNDTGALAAAVVGIAVKGAAEASRMSSDVYLSSPGVSELVLLFEGARRTLSTIRRGIVFSLLYNVVGISCAALGLLNPLWAAVLMPVSSLTVVTNAYRSRMFSKDESP